MTRGTTPTFTIDCPGIDLTHYTVYVTIEQGMHELTLTPECTATQNGCTLTVRLTQEQTLSFSAGREADMQVRAVDAAGNAPASDVMHIDVRKILKEGVITYVG